MRRRRWDRRRHGSTCSRLIVILTIAAALLVVAVVMEPQMLVAGPVLEADDPGQIEQQEVLQTLSSMIGRCAAVLAIHRRGPTPYVEIVVWKADRQNPGSIDPEEIGLISHSRILRSITLYELDTSQASAGMTWSELLNSPTDQPDFTSPDFCDRWRTHTKVRPQVIASGVSDLTYTLTYRGGGRGGVTDAIDRHNTAALLQIVLESGRPSADTYARTVVPVQHVHSVMTTTATDQ